MESMPKLSTPEEELAYLRAEIEKKERELAAQKNEHGTSIAARHELVAKQLSSHEASAAEDVLSADYKISEETAQSEAEAIMAELELGNDTAAIANLQQVMETRGIKNALSVLEQSSSPQLADDFHRYLVRYLAAGLPVKGLDENAPRFRALRMTLYEIALPEHKDDSGQRRERPLKELLSAMEQLYAGLLSVEAATKGEPNHFALELAVPADRADLLFYAAIPNSKKNLFEKQVLAIFPDAHIMAVPNDYNIFADQGSSVIATAKLAEHPALPLKEYPEFDYDPINTVLNAFAKIEATGEGAALQIVVEPRGERHVKHYQKILRKLRKGEKRSMAFATAETELGELGQDFYKTLFTKKPKDEEKVKEAETREAEVNKVYIEELEKKVETPIVGTTIRLAVSGKNESQTTGTLGELEAAFNQFGNTAGNRLSFERLEGRRAKAAFEDFSFRVPNTKSMPLSLRELTTLYHFPPEGIESTPHLKQSRFTHSPAPLGLPYEGVLLGTNAYRGQETPVRLESEDRLRHLYIIGQTGAGKTGLMKSLIMQDIKNGEGCCFIDPHGTDIIDILGAIPPERYEDVIYFDPADLSRPFGLNMLEYDIARPEQKTFIINEMLMIFKRLYGDVPESMGPAFEQYFRNATQLVMEDPESGSTILDIPRVLSNAEFRKLKLARSMNPIVNQFWQEIASQAGGEASLENIVPYITNKFDDFTANDFMRPIIGQQKSSFNFRDVIDNKKILLVNLSKGRLGERNANLLGLIIVGKIFMAALSRADNPRGTFPPFYLYIDEFQNVTTDSIPGILSEARKYKLSLSIAHQFLAQVDDKTRAAVFGNVGNMAVFRVGEEDAEFFEKQFAPVFSARDFVNIENRNAYVRILTGGVPQKPFDMKTADLPALNHAQVDDLMQLSSLTYGRDRATVEGAIRDRYFLK